MSNISLRRAILMALATITLPAVANDSQVTELNPLVVTVSKTPTKASNLIAQTTVITADDLVRYQGQNAFDVLKTATGISHYTSGGSEKVSNLYLRGFDSKGVLVLIDGIRYGSLTTGQPALALLPANDIERIEISYGASGSSLYGANAMGGTIQIFTKKGTHDGSKVALTVGTGSHNALHYGVSAGYTNETTNLSLSANHSETDGINAIVTPYVASQRDDDGFERQSASLGASHKFDRLEVGVNALASRATVQYDKTYTSESDIYDKQTGGAASVYTSYNYRPDSLVKLQYGESLDKSSNYTGTQSTGKFDSHQKQANLSLVHALTVGKLLAGAEHLKEEVDSDTAYTQTHRNNTGVYVGYQVTHNNLDGQAFVRADDNSWYGKNTNYNAGLAYRITPKLRIGANYATGFIAPTFNELYWPQEAWGGGNPDLSPETSKNTEAFVELTGDKHKTRLTGYHSDVKNLIANWPPQNIAEAEIIGVGLTSDWRFNNYVAGISYDYQEANSTTPAANGTKTKSNLSIRPEHKGTAYIGYHYDNFSVRAEYQRVGNYYAAPNHSSPIKGYELINLSGTYQLTPHIEITQRLNNLTNKKYTTNESFGTRYNEDGINFYTAVTFKY